MGSTFGWGRDDHEHVLSLSNGGTAVFLDVLALAACELAESDWERGFALMLCNARVGLGNDDFDLDDLPWSDEAAVERWFLIRTIRLAAARFRWDALGYEPLHAEEYLAAYERLVFDYQPSGTPGATWPPASYERCDKHGLFLGDYADCRLCL
jgi:hypothetical protein